jgi:hypothetical protein
MGTMLAPAKANIAMTVNVENTRAARGDALNL